MTDMDKSKNTYTDEQLKEIVEQHQLWLHTNGQEGKQANLSGMRLVKVNLENNDLRKANFNGANLNGANLKGADFNEADLQNTQLRQTDLTKANLNGAKLNKADAFRAVFKKADLRNAELKACFFKYAHFSDAIFNEKTDCSEANFRLTDLASLNLSGMKFDKTNFEDANLSGTSFTGSDLSKANLNGANLRSADFQNATYTIEQFYTTHYWRKALSIRTDEISKKIDISGRNQLIHELKEELKQEQEKAEKGEDNQGEDSQEKIARLKVELKEQYLYLKNEKLNEGIENAQKELANSLKSADDRIQEYNKSAKIIGRIAIELMGLDLLIIVLFGVYVYCERFMPLFEKLGVWGLTLLSFPIIVILTIAITLLRHQKKLLDEVRHYSAEKRQIELYSGLLKASQHAAAGLNDPQKSAEYVQETFTAIRNRILSEQPHSNTAASASEKEDYGLEAIVKIIADLAAKNDVKK